MVRDELSSPAPHARQRSHHDALVYQCLQLADKYATSVKIQFALEHGVSAVCARWWPSALLYGKDDGLDPQLVYDTCSGLAVPDILIHLAVDPDHVAPRSDRHNRYEADREKQARLAAAYLDLWKNREGYARTRWEVVPGEGAVDEVSGRIWEVVAEHLESMEDF